jgi:hypothetical protein
VQLKIFVGAKKMNKNKIIFVWMFCLTFSSWSACAPNKCTDKSGRVTYSDQPCSSGGIIHSESIRRESSTNHNLNNSVVQINELCRTTYSRKFGLDNVRIERVDESNSMQKARHDERIKNIDQQIVSLCREPISIKSKFNEVINGTKDIKLAIAMCIADNEPQAKCMYQSLLKTQGNITGSETSNGTNTHGISTGLYELGYIGARAVLPNYKIYVEAIVGGGLNGETYILTPQRSEFTALKWIVSGTCLKAGLCSQE